MKTFWKIALGVVLGMVLFTCGCAAFVTVISQSTPAQETGVVDVIATSRPTIAPKQTQMPEIPTKTLMPTPIVTIKPTETPVPTATSKPLPTKSPPTATVQVQSGIQDYVDAYLPLGEEQRLMMIIISEQSASASKNVTLIVQDEWLNTTYMAIEILKGVNTEIRNLDCPTELSAFCTELLLSLDDSDTFADLYIRGVDSIDADLIIESTSYIHKATAHLEMATAILDSM